MEDEEGTAGMEGWWMRKGAAGKEDGWMRKLQKEGEVGGRARNNRKKRLVDEEGTLGREGWWTRKEQQEGKVGG